MAPRKTYVFAILKRELADDKDKKGAITLLEIHDNVESAYAACKEAAGDDQDETEEFETKDGCATFKNKTERFHVWMKKMELKSDASADGNGAASAASSVATKKTAGSAASGIKKTATAPAKKPAAASTAKNTVLQGEEDSLKGLKMLFTGSLNMNRETCETTAKNHGAEIVPPTKMDQADFIIVGAKAGDKKLQEIEDKGLTTITEEEFIEKLGTSDAPSKKRKL